MLVVPDAGVAEEGRLLPLELGTCCSAADARLPPDPWMAELGLLGGAAGRAAPEDGQLVLLVETAASVESRLLRMLACPALSTADPGLDRGRSASASVGAAADNDLLLELRCAGA
jgi:hypothetical protein